MGAAIRGNPVTPRNRKVAFPSHGVGFRRIGTICRDNGVGFQLRRYGLTEEEITIVVERNEPAHPAPPPAWRISRRHRPT